jgi:hypothetical protein
MADAPPGGDPRDKWVTYSFSLSNPTGPGQGSVSALLRRLADQLDGLGEVEIIDISFSSQPTGEENDLRMTVYYQRD